MWNKKVIIIEIYLIEKNNKWMCFHYCGLNYIKIFFSVSKIIAINEYKRCQKAHFNTSFSNSNNWNDRQCLLRLPLGFLVISDEFFKRDSKKCSFLRLLLTYIVVCALTLWMTWIWNLFFLCRKKIAFNLQWRKQIAWLRCKKIMYNLWLSMNQLTSISSAQT